MSIQGEHVIVVFLPSVSVEQIKKHAEDIEENGGKIKDHYYANGDLIHGFSAIIPGSYLNQFRSLRGDEINYIESDGIVTTQS